MRADCHLAQYTDYEDPSDTSFLEEESSSNKEVSEGSLYSVYWAK